jgi:hypothetical protein
MISTDRRPAAGGLQLWASLPAAEADPLRFLVISGKPIGEPNAWYGPIVMTTPATSRTRTGTPRCVFYESVFRVSIPRLPVRLKDGDNVSTLDSKPLRSGHAPVNGINVYYEVHGRKDGVPLVLLHGGGSTIEVTFSKALPVFAGSRRVIALEEQAHGRMTDRNAVSFESSRRDGDEWIADAPFGKVRLRFTPRNSFGVMDHDVKLESGVTIRNPMRVLPNGEGSEFVFTLIRQPGTSDGR